MGYCLEQQATQTALLSLHLSQDRNKTLVREGGHNAYRIIKSHCSPDLEAMSIQCGPFYLPVS